MAIDRQFVIDNIFFGFGKPATGPISSNFGPTGIYTADVKNYNVKDGIAEADKLLTEAGYPRKADGTRFEIVHDILPYGEEWQRYGEYVQQAFGKLGIKVTLRYEDVATWLKRVYTDYDFQITTNFLYNLSDPAIGVHREYHSNSIRPGTVFVNLTGWSSPRTDELMNLATVEPDAAKRNELYHEFQKLVVEAAPIIWSHELNFPTVYNKKYHDLVVSPLGIYANFASAYLEK
jgi:peptide/nickel transport system substrate-binding protein